MQVAEQIGLGRKGVSIFLLGMMSKQNLIHMFTAANLCFQERGSVSFYLFGYAMLLVLSLIGLFFHKSYQPVVVDIMFLECIIFFNIG